MAREKSDNKSIIAGRRSTFHIRQKPKTATGIEVTATNRKIWNLEVQMD